MGTQQILLIVLSVIIVGAAVAVGIEMFNSQDYSSNRAAASADAQLYMTQVLQYYKMPRSLGGLGGRLHAGISANDISNYIGWGGTLPMNNDNASFLIVLPEQNGTEDMVDIKAICNASKNGRRPVVHSRIYFPDGRIETKVGELEFNGAIDNLAFDNIELMNATAGGGSKLHILGW